MTPKKLHRLQALLFLACAIVVPLLLMLPSGGRRTGEGAAAVAGVLFVAVACYHWFKYRKTPEDAVFYDITKQPVDEQIRMSKKVIWIMGLAGTIMSIWTYHDLSALETGARGSVSVWAPVALLYNRFGFWPAVLCWPLLCLYIIGIYAIRLRKAKALTAASQNSDRLRDQRGYL